MKMASGEQVTTRSNGGTLASGIVELLEEKLWSHPPNVPHVHGKPRDGEEIEAGGKPAIEKHIVELRDSACPEIEADISMSVDFAEGCSRPRARSHELWMGAPFDPSPLLSGGGGGRGKRGGPRPPSREDRFIAAGWGCADSESDDGPGRRGRLRTDPLRQEVERRGDVDRRRVRQGIIGLDQSRPTSQPMTGVRSWGLGVGARRQDWTTWDRIRCRCETSRYCWRVA